MAGILRMQRSLLANLQACWPTAAAAGFAPGSPARQALEEAAVEMSSHFWCARAFATFPPFVLVRPGSSVPPAAVLTMRPLTLAGGCGRRAAVPRLLSVVQACSPAHLRTCWLGTHWAPSFGDSWHLLYPPPSRHLAILKPHLLNAYMLATLPPPSKDMSTQWHNVALDSMPLLAEGEVRSAVPRCAVLCFAVLCCAALCCAVLWPDRSTPGGAPLSAAALQRARRAALRHAMMHAALCCAVLCCAVPAPHAARPALHPPHLSLPCSNLVRLRLCATLTSATHSA